MRIVMTLELIGGILDILYNVVSAMWLVYCGKCNAISAM